MRLLWHTQRLGKSLPGHGPGGGEVTQRPHGGGGIDGAVKDGVEVDDVKAVIGLALQEVVVIGLQGTYTPHGRSYLGTWLGVGAQAMDRELRKEGDDLYPYHPPALAHRPGGNDGVGAASQGAIQHPVTCAQLHGGDHGVPAAGLDVVYTQAGQVGMEKVLHALGRLVIDDVVALRHHQHCAQATSSGVAFREVVTTRLPSMVYQTLGAGK